MNRQQLAQLMRAIRDARPTRNVKHSSEVREKLVQFCSERDISVNLFIGRARPDRIVKHRKEFSRLMYDAGFSSGVIGEAVNRDHTTILHHLKEAA